MLFTYWCQYHISFYIYFSPNKNQEELCFSYQIPLEEDYIFFLFAKNKDNSLIFMNYILNKGMTNAEVLHQVEHGYRMPAPPNCPPALYEIMLETWHKDPMKRPTFETLQWKLEDFFTIEGSEYKEAAVAYWPHTKKWHIQLNKRSITKSFLLTSPILLLNVISIFNSVCSFRNPYVFFLFLLKFLKLLLFTKRIY